MQKTMKMALGLLAALMLSLETGGALADDVAINADNFPDATFRAYVEQFDGDGDGILSDAERETVEEIDVNNRGIADLTGVGYFPALKRLVCYGNQLTDLDVSGCPALQILLCGNNQLRVLNVTQNLTWLDCAHNGLADLDVSGCGTLISLTCDDNSLKRLIVRQNPQLQWLSCAGNQLTSLDVTDNSRLEHLDCHDNELTSLDVTQNLALKELNCESNELTALNMTENWKLVSLFCQNNRLTSLDMMQNGVLQTLSCSPQEVYAEASPGLGGWMLDVARLVDEVGRVSNVQSTTGTESGTIVTWSDVQSMTCAYDYDTGYNGQMMQVNVTATAKHAVIFDPNDGKGQAQTEWIEDGEPVGKPADPVRTGYRFDGWYNIDGQLWDFSEPVMQDLVLTAHWTKRLQIPSTGDATNVAVLMGVAVVALAAMVLILQWKKK